ncbi:exonuclease [Acidovorax sp. Leaf76]|uniref:PD-(D/E)XK nuclease family protein n=1 Tax=unclassified Acidovorax TaxID=2684926 RepID=UPI0006F6B50A|nr:MULTISPECIES: PD-(D/E)XK nuclease family protein [unclassified Acidovorax]KQO24350.1 exonuclease [Acidovorax sp. Leaf76]KQO39377.1 exonuclease [Acidovorax sp. Leaf84]KQS24542.1 exonuclease [Acidovorax sp. Leaf191]
MTVIAKTDQCTLLWRRVLAQVALHIEQCAAHPARTVVLVPYAQLMPWAQRYWGMAHPDGFAPRFETTRNWARQLAAFVPQGDDLAGDVARDTLTARLLLDKAGLSAQRDVLATPLQEAAAQLAPAVAAVPPSQREAWGEQARALLPPADEGSALRFEAVVARIALEWVLASRHATDVLFEPGVARSIDALVLLPGFQPDALAQALQAHWGGKASSLALWTGSPDKPAAGHGRVALHAAQDAEDEAQRAAACVLGHLAAGRIPVALAANDRALTRRIGAHLASAGVAVRDENGWTLSTTRAAARLMAALTACAWDATTDAVLDWLKHVPRADAALLARLERALRKSAMASWGHVARHDWASVPDVALLVAQVQTWRDSLRAARALPQWLQALRTLLSDTGQWTVLEEDAAGARVLSALRLQAGQEAELDGWGDGAGRRMTLAEFTRWANEVLEADRYVPAQMGDAPVVVLPMPQLLARPFAALVLPGCDEKRLQAAPEPAGEWTQAQREAWGLPTRASAEMAQRAAWQHALQTPAVDVLWRTGDEGGEPLLASPLVLALHLDGAAQGGADSRTQRTVDAAPTERPQPQGDRLPVQRLSSTAYSDLRHCPYRFFALRQLGLQEADELAADVDKRDFGNWLHAVLQHFHEALLADPVQSPPERVARMDAAAQAVTREQRLGEGDFLPFAAGWPQVRDGYLRWLAQHEQTGARFRQAELRTTQPLGSLELVGTLDRVDAVDAVDTVPAVAAQGEPATLVIDYKTENDTVTRKRIQSGAEDTQLAFYAALLSHDTLRAAYVNVGERGETQMHEQEDVVHLRDLLVEGIQHDFERIAAGDPLPALGEGMVCEYCAARGLCRKDFWNE